MIELFFVIRNIFARYIRHLAVQVLTSRNNAAIFKAEISEAKIKLFRLERKMEKRSKS